MAEQAALCYSPVRRPRPRHTALLQRGEPGESPAVLTVCMALPSSPGSRSEVWEVLRLWGRGGCSVRAHALLQAPMLCLQGRSQLAAAALGGSTCFIPHEGLSLYPW